MHSDNHPVQMEEDKAQKLALLQRMPDLTYEAGSNSSVTLIGTT